MPFTFAHPAAAVPLCRPLGRLGALSGLIIGSLTPDFVYFLPIAVSRAESHSVAGLFWFCLPVGLVTYLLFHLLIKKPLLSLLPLSVSTRLSMYAAAGSALPSSSWTAVVVSLFLGAVSHIVWDSFTHLGEFGVVATPILTTPLCSVGNYHVQLYVALQHLSTVLGLGLLTWWSWQWLRRAPVQPARFAMASHPFSRNVLLAVFVLIPGVVAILMVAPFPSTFNVVALQRFVAKVIFTSVPILGVELLLYSSCWHMYALLRDRQ